MIWYIDNLGRFRAEREALEALVATTEWLEGGDWRIDSSIRLVWDAEIHVSGRSFPISLRYPNHFPHSPPVVLPRGDDISRWSSHQYAGGELCLEFGPDNWHPDLSGSDMIQSAFRLLEGELQAPEAKQEVPSRHQTTIGQDLRGEFGRLPLTNNFIEFTSSLQEGDLHSAKVISLLHEESFVVFISSVTLADGKDWVEDLPSSFKSEYKRTMAVLRLPADADLPSCTNKEKFFNDLSGFSSTIQEVDFVLLIRGQAFYPYWLGSSGDVYTLTPILPSKNCTRSSSDHDVLKGKKIGVIGCGSIGSKVAVSLARCGVGSFLLVDDDVMLSDNLVRNDLAWHEVGRHKADGVASRITSVNPAANCIKRRHRLGGQEASGSLESLIQSMSDCDLLIDATADSSAFNYLCAAVEAAGKPLLWGEVFGGGFGGLIARFRPGLEPSPATMRFLVEKWCADQGKPVPRSARNYELEAEVPRIADDADVSVIASHVSRMAIDVLIGRSPSTFPCSVYMIGLTEGWLFGQPFETYPIDVGRPSENAGMVDPLDETASAEELTRIKQLFTEFTNAATDTTKSSETA